MFYPIPSKAKYKLTRDYNFAEAGFEFDGASIPYVAQWLTYSPFHPRVMRAAVVHDWHYREHEINRLNADMLFHSDLRRAGCKPWKARLMYWAVRLFGRGAWERTSGDGLR